MYSQLNPKKTNCRVIELQKQQRGNLCAGVGLFKKRNSARISPSNPLTMPKQAAFIEHMRNDCLGLTSTSRFAHALKGR